MEEMKQKVMKAFKRLYESHSLDDYLETVKLNNQYSIEIECHRVELGEYWGGLNVGQIFGYEMFLIDTKKGEYIDSSSYISEDNLIECAEHSIDELLRMYVEE